MQLSQKLKQFSALFIAFLQSALNFQHLVRKMSLMALRFLKLLSHKDVFTFMYKRSCFWKLFACELVHDSLKLLKSAQKYFYYTFSSVWGNLREKKVFLGRSEILGLLVRTLTAEYEYPRSNTDKLPLSVQMQLPQKLETISAFFIAFLESALNFQHFQQKMSRMAEGLLELLSPKDAFTYMHKRSCFSKLSQSESVSESLKLL